MSRFQVTILGCGSALPTLRHSASSQLVEVHDKVFMLDCGEGTQLQMRRSRTHFAKVRAIFITHSHGDHCFGLMGLISTFGMLGRTSPLHIYAPENMQEVLKMQLDVFCTTFEYQVVLHSIDTSRRCVIYQDKSLTVETIPLEHRVPCAGFLFREKPSLPHLRRDMLDFYGIPTWQYNNIKRGQGWTTPEGEVIDNARLTLPAAEPLSYAYCSDTRYMPHLASQVKGADMLYHESTYISADEDKAALYHHSTAAQAARVARAAGVGALILGHYSSRYPDERCFLDEAKALFPQTFAAQEMDIYDVERKNKI